MKPSGLLLPASRSSLQWMQESLLSAWIRPKEGVVIILALHVGAKPHAHNKLFSWEPVSIDFLVADRGPA